MMNYLQRKRSALMHAGSLGGYLRTVSGTSPLTLADCMHDKPVTVAVSGNSVQNRTPTPRAPVEIVSCGDYVEDGKYRVSITYSGDTSEPITYNIYLPEPINGNGRTNDTVTINFTKKTAELEQQWYKYALTGEESSIISGSNDTGSVFGLEIPYNRTSGVMPLSTHCVFRSGSVGIPTATSFHGFISGGSDYIHFFVPTDMCTDEAEFKAWLAEQYANGTPVEVLYKLATASITTTDISALQDWDSIPTLCSGTNIITAETEVEPSSMAVEYYSKTEE